MTLEEKLQYMKVMLDDKTDTNDSEYKVYLDLAKQRLLTHIYPFDQTKVEIPQRYDMQHIELAVAIYVKKGAEGESSHDENGVRRTYKTEGEILAHIPTTAGFPS